MLQTLIAQAKFELDDQEKNEWALEDIYAEDNCQGQKIGSKLVEAFEIVVRPQSLYLMSTPSAVGFYKKLGFTPAWNDDAQEREKNKGLSKPIGVDS